MAVRKVQRVRSPASGKAVVQSALGTWPWPCRFFLFILFTAVFLSYVVSDSPVSLLCSRCPQTLTQTVQSPDSMATPAVKKVGGDCGSAGSSRQGADVVVSVGSSTTFDGSTEQVSALPPEGQLSLKATATLVDAGNGDLARVPNGNVLNTRPANGLVHVRGNSLSNGGVNGSIDHPASRNASGGDKKTRGVQVSADDVWKAFLSTRPSLSSEDRARYDSAYQKFRRGSRPADFNPISSVDDGTLRTALK